MNNKGQVFFLTFMIGLVILLLALALAPGLRNQIDETRSSTGMDCGNSSISTFNKATCFVVDVNMFYFIGGLIFIAGSVIGAKVMLG